MRRLLLGILFLLSGVTFAADPDCGERWGEVSIPRTDQIPWGPRQSLSAFKISFDKETGGFRFKGWELNIQDRYVSGVSYFLGKTEFTISFSEKVASVFSYSYPAIEALNKLRRELDEMKSYWEVNKENRKRIEEVVKCAQIKIAKAHALVGK